MAREYVAARFAGLQLATFGDSYLQPFTIFLRGGNEVLGVNVVGYIEGSSGPESFIVITAHYDHLGVRNGEVFNGADDNGSGTAALMALAAYFAEHKPRHSIIFAALDAEEGGLRGARAFVERPPVALSQMAINLNMDMISHNDRELYVVGTHHYPFLKPFVQRVVTEVEIALPFGHDSPELGTDDWTSQSDHAPFHGNGIPFLYFGVEDHPDYHQPTDVFHCRGTTSGRVESDGDKSEHGHDQPQRSRALRGRHVSLPVPKAVYRASRGLKRDIPLYKIDCEPYK